MEIMKKAWIHSDDLQWVSMLSDTSASLIEVREWPNDEYIVVIGDEDLSDYTEAEIVDYIEGYGYESITKLKQIYPTAWAQVALECIFESHPNVEYCCIGPFKSETEAEIYVRENLVKEDE